MFANGATRQGISIILWSHVKIPKNFNPGQTRPNWKEICQKRCDNIQPKYLTCHKKKELLNQQQPMLVT